MYPSLTAVGSSNRWYAKKNTAHDKLADIINKEELLAEKNEKAFKVGATILIRGKIIDPALVSSIRDQEDHRIETDEVQDEVSMEMIDNNETDDMLQDNTSPIRLNDNHHQDDEINDFFNTIPEERERNLIYYSFDDNDST